VNQESLRKVSKECLTPFLLFLKNPTLHKEEVRFSFNLFRGLRLGFANN
jgi:hypothetical protein